MIQHLLHATFKFAILILKSFKRWWILEYNDDDDDRWSALIAEASRLCSVVASDSVQMYAWSMYIVYHTQVSKSRISKLYIRQWQALEHKWNGCCKSWRDRTAGQLNTTNNGKLLLLLHQLHLKMTDSTFYSLLTHPPNFPVACLAYLHPGTWLSSLHSTRSRCT